MVGGPGLRFALEAAFLIALAVAAGLAELSPTTIVLVMGAAWLLVAVIEWLAWREGPRVTRIVREEAAPPPIAVEPEPRPAAAGASGGAARTEEADVTTPAATVTPGEDTQDIGPPDQQPAAPVPADERAAP